jgi:7-cyano-7-deazaguanine synthase in queuosine biosynthesis
MREHVLTMIKDTLGRSPSELHQDLLAVAMSAYAADLSVPRITTPDGWSRQFRVYVPVFKPDVWFQAVYVLEKTLSFLSGDTWEFRFRERNVLPPGDEKVVPSFDTTCLFSGGLDSLCGAIDLLARGRKVLLVGHYGGGTTSKFQRQVYDELKRVYEDAVLAMRFQVLPPSLPREREDGIAEETQRTRSFLFFALGLAVAGAVGDTMPLYIPENGLISLNIPMTGTRSGSASTRTTHPFYIHGMRELLRYLGLHHELVLPYRFKTKAEMLQESANRQLLEKLTPLSISCAHPDQRRREGLTPGGHCGHCFPCLIRRATVAAAGFPDAEYDTDARRSPPNPSGDRGRDYRAVCMALARLNDMPRHRVLFEVLKAGPLDPAEIDQFIGVYERGMTELSLFYK